MFLRTGRVKMLLEAKVKQTSSDRLVRNVAEAVVVRIVAYVFYVGQYRWLFPCKQGLLWKECRWASEGGGGSPWISEFGIFLLNFWQ